MGPITNPDGHVITSGHEVADKFNKYFTEMFTTEDLTSVPQMQDMDCECGYLSDIVVDDDIVLKKLNKLSQTRHLAQMIFSCDF